MIPWIIGGGALAAGVWGAARIFAWRSIYRPNPHLDGDPGTAGLAFEEILFATEDGARLHGWWIPHPAARGSVVYCHGNAGNVSSRLDVAAGLHALGVNVFLFDYRGYGRSSGIATEVRTYRDACAAFEVVRARHDDADNPPVVAFGASLGGAIAIELARRKPLRGLVIEGTFSSITDIGVLRYPWLPVRLMNAFPYAAADRIAGVHIPKLLAHSRDDAVVPYPLGQFLYQRAAEPKAFVELRGDHGEAGWLANPAYATALKSFLERCLPAIVQ
jgi:fermentation-respiration switch protein FrsA (DUF1100 family)